MWEGKQEVSISSRDEMVGMAEWISYHARKLIIGGFESTQCQRLTNFRRNTRMQDVQVLEKENWRIEGAVCQACSEVRESETRSRREE